MPEVTYPFDVTGTAPSNRVANELYTLTEVNSRPYRIIVPVYAPFYLDGFLAEHIGTDGVARPLIEGSDYYMALPFMAASRSVGRMVYGGIQVINPALNNVVRLSQYQTIGGQWVANKEYVYQQLLENGYNVRTVYFDQVTNVQQTFPPAQHDEDAADIEGHREFIASLDAIAAAILARSPSANRATDAEVMAGLPVNKTFTFAQFLMYMQANYTRP